MKTIPSRGEKKRREEKGAEAMDQFILPLGMRHVYATQYARIYYDDDVADDL